MGKIAAASFVINVKIYIFFVKKIKMLGFIVGIGIVLLVSKWLDVITE